MGVGNLLFYNKNEVDAMEIYNWIEQCRKNQNKILFFY